MPKRVGDGGVTRPPSRPRSRATRVEATGASLGALLNDLDRRDPGIPFRMADGQERIRPNMCVFVNGQAMHRLAQPLQPIDDVGIVQALSGG